ncbi:MAG: retropepsin-like aspartic protease, partial [Gaiellaceae bacterium]
MSEEKKIHFTSHALRVLLDSGASKSIILNEFAKEYHRHTMPQPLEWTTKAGSIMTNQICTAAINLPEFNSSKKIVWEFHIHDADPKTQRYDVIIGRDLMHELGIKLDFEKCVIGWDGAEIAMREYRPFYTNDQAERELEESFASDHVSSTTERVMKILDANYQKADLKKLANDCTHLEAEDQHSLYLLLKDFEDLFDGTLGDWNTKPVDLKLKDDAKPYHSKPYDVAQIHWDTLGKEVERLCKLGVL